MVATRDAGVEAIEELISEFGIRATISACLRSSAGEHFGVGATLEIIQATLRTIAAASNPQLEAEVMAMGAGVLLDDDATVGRIAAKHGLDPQALRDRVAAYQ